VAAFGWSPSFDLPNGQVIQTAARVSIGGTEALVLSALIGPGVMTARQSLSPGP
tara:strand:+ start:15599 stop:15760 length:162 start_codon:yes stop_codon:yes gene_type:complete